MIGLGWDNGFSFIIHEKAAKVVGIMLTGKRVSQPMVMTHMVRIPGTTSCC